MREIALALVLMVDSSAALAAANKLSGMYDTATIANAQPRLRSRVTEIYEKAFRPNLLPEEQRALSNLTIQSPLTGDPVVGYYSDSRNGVVTVPATSLLFFEDLCESYAWLYVKGYRLETVEEYMTMLKYKEPQAFGGRYPPPLKALGIPNDALDDTKVNDLSLRFRNSGYAFILGHELGHIRFQHKGYGNVSADIAQGNERQADQFGLELMRRVGEIPMGAMLFFQAGIYHFENRADFGSDAEWQEFLANRATHPVTADRLKRLSEQIDALAPDFARGPNRAAGMETVHFIGRRFADFAAFLNDPLLQRVMRARAEKAHPSSLLPRREKQSRVEMNIFSKPVGDEHAARTVSDRQLGLRLHQRRLGCDPARPEHRDLTGSHRDRVTEIRVRQI